MNAHVVIRKKISTTLFSAKRSVQKKDNGSKNYMKNLKNSWKISKRIKW